MLTLRDHLRLKLKGAEFRHGRAAQKRALRLGLLRTPYRDQDDRLRAVFVHIPKSAGTSLRKALYDTGSFHIPASRYLAADPERFRAYFTFCVVRNPWDRMNSAFHYLFERRSAAPDFVDHRWAASELARFRDFRDFVHRLGDDTRLRARILSYVHFRNQLDWITLPAARDRPIVDHVGRFEDLAATCDLLRDRLGLEVHLPRERCRPDRRDYRRLYDSRMVDIVAGLYRTDIDVLGYAFE